jgi:mRNA interferase RelE/StbE
VSRDQLHGAKDRYKIKLKRAGYRLVYQVIDTEIVVLVIAVGKREGSAIYEAAAKR